MKSKPPSHCDKIVRHRVQRHSQIGDWGRQGEFNQSDLAEVMAAAARDVPPEFVVSVGDNFYPSASPALLCKRFVFACLV